MENGAKHRVSDLARTGKRSIEISADKVTEFGIFIDVPVDRNSEYELSAPGSRPKMWQVEGAAHSYTSVGIPTVRVSKAVKGYAKTWTR